MHYGRSAVKEKMKIIYESLWPPPGRGFYATTVAATVMSSFCHLGTICVTHTHKEEFFTTKAPSHEVGRGLGAMPSVQRRHARPESP